MKFSDNSKTVEQCLLDVKTWIEEPERTAEEIIQLLRSIRAQTKKEVALIASAVAMIRNENSEVLLLRRPLQDRSYPGKYSFPGGQKDPEDMDLGATARREAREETQLECEIVQLYGTLHSAIPRRERIYQITAFEMVLAPASSRSIVLSSEHDEAIFLTPKTALERDAEGTLPLAGPATRLWLQALMKGK